MGKVLFPERVLGLHLSHPAADRRGSQRSGCAQHFESAMREGWTVGRGRGVALADDYVAQQLAAADALPADMRSSMLNDLIAGNRLEAPWLSGAVARMAAEAGLPAPVSATLFSAVKPYVNGARSGARSTNE